MPQADALKTISSSPAEVALEMIEHIRDDRTMDIQKKLAHLNELCLEHVSFHEPGEALKVIAILGGIISSDPNPEVRAAALQVMERMIALEEKAENEQHRAAIDWCKVDVLLSHAKQQTEQAPLAVAAQGNPESVMAIAEQTPTLPIIASPRVAERPQPAGATTPALEDAVEPPILKFLRSVAGTDSDANIRLLADRVMARIANLTNQGPQAPLTPALAKG